MEARVFDEGQKKAFKDIYLTKEHMKKRN